MLRSLRALAFLAGCISFTACPVVKTPGIDDGSSDGGAGSVSLSSGGQNAHALSLIGIDPPQGPTTGGTRLAISGYGMRDGVTATIQGQPAQFVTLLGETTLIVLTPPGMAGAADVTVKNPDGATVSLQSVFSFVPSTGTLSVTRAIPPSAGMEGGDAVVIMGTGFVEGTRVFFGPLPATAVELLGPDVLVATTPRPVDTTVTLSVETPDGTRAALADPFRFVDGPGANEPLAVSTVLPARGPASGGTRVALVGTGFQRGLTVSVGGVETPQPPEVRSSSVVLVTTPAGTVGPASIVVTQQGSDPVTLVNGYTYTDDALTLTEVLPAVGSSLGGTTVALLGTGFADGMTVTFGGAMATDVTVTSDSVATAVTPAGTLGMTDVAVTLDGTTTTLSGGFLYVQDSSTGDTLVLSAAGPNRGPVGGGTRVILTGRGLNRVNAVRFGMTAASISEVLSSEAIVVSTPPATNPGRVDIVVETATGESATLTQAFEYHLPEATGTGDPELTGLVPRTGPSTGGTRIAAHGRNLTGVVGVKVGGLAATDVTSLDSAVVTFTAPEGVPGPADVVVTLAGGREVTLRRSYFYFRATSTVPEPVANSITPAVGPIAGGTQFVVNGSRFAQGVRVLIDGEEAVGVRRLSSILITGTTPPGTRTGAVDVAVVHPDGHVAFLTSAFSYFRADSMANWPRIDEIRPPTASTHGGTQLALTGTSFAVGASVLVDQQPGQEVVVASSSRITFRAPPHAAGQATVSVVNPDGTFFNLQNGLTYEAEPPVISEIMPTEGPANGGTGITIRGSGFDSGATVTVCGVAAIDVVVLDPTLILALTPPCMEGNSNIVVTNTGGLSATAMVPFRYTPGDYPDSPPLLSSLNPPRGPTSGGTRVLLTGQNFKAGARLLVGGVVATELVIVSPTEATATIPAGAPETVDVALINPDGQASILRDAFSYVDSVGVEPTLSGLAPFRGPEIGGTPAVLAGTGFTTNMLVFFGNTPAENVVVLSDGFLSLVTPAHAAGAVDITVTTDAGRTARLLDGYTYVPSPRISGVSPAVGPLAGGTLVLIGGSNFQAGATVMFGSSPAANVEVRSGSIIAATTPARAEGLVDLIVRNPDGQTATLQNGFEFLDLPTLSGVWPSSGPTTGGTRAIISGDGLRNGATVKIGGTAATGVTWLSNAQLTAILPPGPVGPADVEVTNPDGQRVTLTGGFTRVDPATLGSAPTVTGCTPAVGSVNGDTAAQVAGTGFVPNARAFFGGSAAVTGFMTTDLLAVRTPARPAGMVTVDVTLPNGLTARRTNCFTYSTNLGSDDPPVISAIQPSAGPTSGGADVVVTGDDFQTGAVLLIGDRLATSVTVVSPTRLEGRTPAGSVGSADVLVANPDGKTARLPGGYTYLAPPVVSTVVPPEGPSIGGTVISIRGQGFLMGAVVRVGSVQATNVQVVSATEIRATTPPGTPGVADVTVVNSDGQVGTLPAAFAYTPPPLVTGISPTSGSTVGDEWITVNGSGFRAGATVKFGSALSPEVQVLAGTQLRAKTPASMAGTVNVTVTNADGYGDTLMLAFTFVSPPTISSVSPTSGPDSGGTTVTIAGSNFRMGATVMFGNTPAPTVTFVNASVITAVSPARPAGGVAVTVRNPDGQQAVLPASFVYFPPVPPPRLTSVSPNFGPVVGGGQATLSGADFQYGARVFFGMTEVPSAQVAVIADSLIRVRTPAGAMQGAVNVRVINPDGQSSVLTNAYTYLPALALPPLGLTSITPNRSGLDGGTLASVLGNGFPPDVQFTVVRGGVSTPVPVRQIFSAVAVQVELPAVATAGQYDLVARSPGTGETATLPSAVLYKNLDINFTTKRGRLPNEARPNDATPVMADFNKDGFNDVFVLRGPRQSVYLQNRGTAQPGWFDNVTSVLLQGESDNDGADNAQYPLTADFNLDGWPDILTWRGYYNHFLMWESRGNGVLVPGPAWDVGSNGPIVYDWVVGDLDGRDGPDVFVCTSTTDKWLRNLGPVKDGNGNILLDSAGRPRWRGFEVRTFNAIVNGVNRQPNEDTRGCDMGDVDGDGDLDVVMGNAFNIASRLYLSNASVQVPGDEYGYQDDFTTDTWSENQGNGSVSGGIYSFQITNISDPYISKDVPDFDEQYNRLKMRYRSYPNGPTSIVLYYYDINDCNGFNSLCSQSFPIVNDGQWRTLDVGITDAEWIDEDRDIYLVRFDFEGQTALGTVQLDDLSFSRNTVSPTFIDVSGSPMFTFSSDARAVRMVDADHDGRLDILFANYNQDSYVLFNKVDGSGNQVFQKRVDSICHDDLCRNSSSNPPVIPKATGLVVGADRNARVAGDALDPTQKFVDINRDGCVDIMMWFENQGWLPRFYINKKVAAAPAGCTGQFIYAPSQSTDTANPMRGIYQGTTGTDIAGMMGPDVRTDWGEPYAILGDVNNDGWHDLYQSIPNNQDRLYLRRPVVQGAITYMRLIDVTTEGLMARNMDMCHKAQATDVNRDGAPDIVYATYSECTHQDAATKIRVLINDGTGNLVDESNRLQQSHRSRTTDLLVADLNNDGLEDLMTLNRNYYTGSCNTGTDQIYLFQQGMNGTFTNVTALANLGSAGNYFSGGFFSATAVDMDVDGDKDIVLLGDGSFQRRLYTNGGDPLGRGAPYFFDTTGNFPSTDGRRAAVVDFNRDNKPDLYIARNGQNRLFQGDGRGNYSDVTAIYMNQVPDDSYFALPGKWTGSQFTDILVGNWAQMRRIHVARADNSLADLSDSNMRMGVDSRGGHNGYSIDLNGDGLLDFMGAGWTGRPIFYQNVGNGVFEDKSAEVFIDTFGEQTTDIAIADFDLDGDQDVFLCNYEQQNRILYNRQR